MHREAHLDAPTGQSAAGVKRSVLSSAHSHAPFSAGVISMPSPAGLPTCSIGAADCANTTSSGCTVIFGLSVSSTS